MSDRIKIATKPTNRSTIEIETIERITEKCNGPSAITSGQKKNSEHVEFIVFTPCWHKTAMKSIHSITVLLLEPRVLRGNRHCHSNRGAKLVFSCAVGDLFKLTG